MGKKVNDLNVSNEVPDVIIGGMTGTNSFRSFTKAVLIAFINNLIGARKNGITLTNLTGSTITNSAFVGRNILLVVVDDFTHNIGFAKSGSTDAERKASNSVVFEELTASTDQTFTFIFE